MTRTRRPQSTVSRTHGAARRRTMNGVRIPDELLLLADTQDGLVTRRQAAACGMSPAAIRHALGAGGHWQRLAAGIYATFTGRLTPRHRVRAALLRGGAAAMISGGHACRAYGLRYVPDDAPLICLVPAGAQPAAMAFAEFRRAAALPASRWIDGVPVAPPARAVIDTCRGRFPLRAVRALLCEAVQSGLTTRELLADAVGDARWQGSALVRLALGDVRAGCRSAPECELRDLVRTSLVLDEPLWNRPLPEEADAQLTPDAHWRDARVVVEVDSSEWHRLGDGPERTERRRAHYAALGWTVVPVSPWRLRHEPRTVLAEIEAAVQSGHRRHAGRRCDVTAGSM
ncbi:type IV toxin-antitoxin system AbiEi family antitoxin domain-containing protein [Jiangella mangrovi]|uniref:DUF559 domain-containing protein n=1 Tax=Jiangella mangrovi TaxID=1524084 RepID=A0A7W9LJD7_9ACTN|nr:type IV toxin-antitoxin system AbiEi family antitoxin domain-containing protein [Jiangella mangrovi]MBB5785938.1 hypothetical protein [Jiangella mangrovi]